MAFSEIELKRVEKLVGDLCRRRTPEHLRDELRFEYEIDGHSILIWEIRPRWDDPAATFKMGVAKLRLFRSRNEWKLYWMRRDLKWHEYDPERNIGGLDDLVEEVEIDQYGAFFG